MIKPGTKFMVHAYKYNGWLYRTTEYPYVLYEDKNVLCLYLPKNHINIIKAAEATPENKKRFFFQTMDISCFDSSSKTNDLM